MPRLYRSTVRDQQAGETRVRVLRTAAELFASHGYAATSVRQLATAAGVSVNTLYAIGGKPVLFRSALRELLNGTLDGTHLLDRDELMTPLDAPEPPTLEQALAITAEMLAASNQRVARLWAAFEEAANTDAELADAYADEAASMRRDSRRAILRLVNLGVCPEPADLDTAADLCWAAAHPRNYALLTQHAGWSPERFRDWLAARWHALLTAAPA